MILPSTDPTNGNAVRFLDTFPPKLCHCSYGRLGVRGSLGYEDKPVIVQGNAFSRSISAHAPSRLLFELEEPFASFEVAAAFNDDVPPTEEVSADFEVYVDGRLSATVKCLRPGADPVPLSVKINGARWLELAISTERRRWAHTLWINPRLHPSEGSHASTAQDSRSAATLDLPSTSSKSGRGGIPQHSFARLRMIRPHGLAPAQEACRVLVTYRTPPRSLSIGLGVNAGQSAQVLRDMGIVADALAVADANELRGVISEVGDELRTCLIEGFFLAPEDLVVIAHDFPDIQFIVRCHSQVAFLQIEPGSIRRMREVLTYSRSAPNLRLAGNSRRFTNWASEAWRGEVLYLPNLYRLPVNEQPAREDHRALRLASFGAMRLQKHHAVSAAASLIVGRRLHRDVEFFVNSGREEMGADTPLRALESLTMGIPGFTLTEVSWQSAPEFRRTIATMDLCFQLSSTETFNLVTADAAAAGVPSVVGEVLDWCPVDWHSPIDDPAAAAEVALRLLADSTAGQRARAALDAYCHLAIAEWQHVVKART